MPQLVLGFPGSYCVGFADFLCVFEIAAAGVTNRHHGKWNMFFNQSLHIVYFLQIL